MEKEKRKRKAYEEKVLNGWGYKRGKKVKCYVEIEL